MVEYDNRQVIIPATYGAVAAFFIGIVLSMVIFQAVINGMSSGNPLDNIGGGIAGGVAGSFNLQITGMIYYFAHGISLQTSSFGQTQAVNIFTVASQDFRVLFLLLIPFVALFIGGYISARMGKADEEEGFKYGASIAIPYAVVMILASSIFGINAIVANFGPDIVSTIIFSAIEGAIFGGIGGKIASRSSVYDKYTGTDDRTNKKLRFGNLRRVLQETFSRKEKIDSLIVNLDNLGEKGTVDKDHQLRLSEEYKKALENVNLNIENIKKNIVEKIANLQKNLDSRQLDKQDLDTRFKVGEMSEQIYNSTNTRLSREIDKINDMINECKILLDTKVSSDVGGRIDVPINKTKSANFGTSSIQFSMLQDLTMQDFTTFNGYSEIEFVGKNMIAAIGAGAMIISMFLPWANYFGMGIYSPQGAISLVLGITGAAGIFMKNSKAGNLALTVAGIIGILLNVGSLFGFERALLAIGYYVFLAGCIMITYVGVSNLKEMS